MPQTRATAQAVSTARGGHSQRIASSRAGTTRAAPLQALPPARERGVASRFASPSVRDRGVIVSRRGAERFASIPGRQARGAVTRSGFQGNYQSAMLRGPGNRFAAMSACSTVRGRRICGGSRQVAMRWSGGLAPAAGIQSSCPDGTMATLAVGHENVVRCLPM